MRLTKYILVLALSVVIVTVASAQRAPLPTMYMLNPYQNIQAFGGFDRSLSASLMYRSQWSPLANNPRYFHFNTHLPVYLLKGGAGISFEQEDLGLESNSSMKVSYNFVLRNQFGIFSAGASFGFQQKRLDGSSITTPEGVYTNGGIDHGDTQLPTGVASSVKPLWGISGLWKYEGVTAGLQLDNFFAPGQNFELGVYNPTRLMSVYADYQYSLTEEVELIPSVLIRTNYKLIQLNFGAIVNYGNIFGGINMRGYSGNSIESLGIITGIKFNKHYTLAYSYDLGLSALKNSTEGSHEIMIKYNLNKILNTGLPPRIIYNPRNL